MTAIIVWLVLVLWVTGWALTARALFRAWRPSRVPVCTEANHVSGRDGGIKGQGHAKSCYHRRRPDLTRASMDSDGEAAAGAMVTSLLWFPVIAAALFIRHDPPQLEAEKEARYQAAIRRNAELEAQLDRELERPPS